MEEIEGINENLKERVNKGKKLMKHLCLKSLNSGRKISTRTIKKENLVDELYGEMTKLPEIKQKGKLSHRDRGFGSVRKLGEIKNWDFVYESLERSKIRI